MEYPYEIILNKGGATRFFCIHHFAACASELTVQNGTYCIVQIWAVLID